MSSSPITPPQALPRIIAAADILPAMKSIISRKVAVRNTILESVTTAKATYQNVVKPLADVQNECSGELAVIDMFRYASPDPAAREASDEAIGLMDNDDAAFTANAQLYLLINAVIRKNEPLAPEEAHYLSFIHHEFTSCGHGRLDAD